ncbi:MAG: NUDIX domain-containing protein [bacterium]|nr:NUDIX domain-containing protein [bacterium]
MHILDHTVNPFNGVVVNTENLPGDPTIFHKSLAESIQKWQAEAYAVVWLEIPIQLSALISIAVEAGFTFHHSGEKYLMLTLSIQKDAFIPSYATHYIGAGGVVLNKKNELLVVSEKHRRSNTPSYKLPGGALHPGEHLAECVVREIQEETGVQTQFEGLVCFRHWHGYRYGKSDIYFVCRLHPITHEVTIQESEIEQCLWMPVNEYLQSEFVHTFNRTIVQAALKTPGVVPTVVEGYSDPSRHEIFLPPDLDRE